MSSGWNTYTLINRNETPNLSLFCEKEKEKKKERWMVKTKLYISFIFFLNKIPNLLRK